jgi:pilus assembly protein CpaB
MADTRAGGSRSAALLFTSCAVVLSGVTGWLLLHLLHDRGYSNEPTRPVVVAARELSAGQPLRREDLKLVSWPSSSVPRGAFDRAQALLEPEARVPTVGLAEGEPILRERLASAQAGPGLAALVRPHARAVAVKVDRELAAVRLLYPGARVDVLATLREPVGRFVATRTVIENARVLAIGTFADVQSMRRSQAGGQNGVSGGGQVDTDAVVTLELSPADAEKLSLTAREGKIDLTLRNAADEDLGGAHGVSSSELFVGVGRTPPAAAPAPAAAAPTPAVPASAPHAPPAALLMRSSRAVSRRLHTTHEPATAPAAAAKEAPSSPSSPSIEVYGVDSSR